MLPAFVSSILANANCVIMVRLQRNLWLFLLHDEAVLVFVLYQKQVINLCSS